MKRSLRTIGIALAALLLSSPTVLAASWRPEARATAPAAKVDLSSPAAELRVDLDRLLAEHAFLTIEQMRSGLLGAPDFAAAATAVEANSTEIAASIGSIYGDAATEPFGDIWRSHIGYLVDYAVSLRTGDTAGRDAALDGLAVYRTQLKSFLGDANPGIDLAEITEALDMHTAQLIEFIDRVHEADYTGAYELEREAYPHMFEIGDALAKLIANRFPDRFRGVRVAYSAAGTLRVTLDRLLAEHAFLAAEAMRSGLTEAPDFGAAAAAIDDNSAELESVVQAAYGKAAAAAFRDLWDAHIKAYVAYIDATRANDSAARAQATSQVNLYASQLADFLAGANPHLDAAALTSLLQQHAGHLTSQVEAYGAADYERTYEEVRAGYSHMFMTGEALALAIATQFPDLFPTDAAAPDTATVPDHHGEAGIDLILLGILGAALALGIALRKGTPSAARIGRLLR
jgi:hypothetical protein